jgi:FAD/FMN-containing dehydrogenase
LLRGVTCRGSGAVGRAARRSDPRTGGVYINFMGGEGGEHVRAAYGDTKYQRLAALKARFDPDNILRVNQNITPVGQRNS